MSDIVLLKTVLPICFYSGLFTIICQNGVVLGEMGVAYIEIKPPIIGGIMKVKSANRLMSIIDEIWVIHLQEVDTLLMIGI
jgi:hypothetical protein